MKIANVYVQNKCISIISNKFKIIEKLSIEYKDYFKFKIEEKVKGNEKINIIESKRLYHKYKDKNEIKYNKTENFFKKDRNCLVVMNKPEKNIDVLCEDYGVIESQYVGEILISLFGKHYENNGFYFLHAAGVAKNDNAILFTGEKNSGKTSIMLLLLQNGFDFIANSRIGINNEMLCIGQPYMLGMRLNTAYNLLSSDEQNKFFNTDDYKRVNKNLELERFNNDKESILKRYHDRKINLKNQDIKDIFDCNLKNNAKVRTIIIPEYCKSIQKIEVRKLEENEKITMLMDNYESGVYSPVRYLNELYNRNNRIIPNNVIKNIDFYKIKQNENTNKELIEWINEKMIGEKSKWKE